MTLIALLAAGEAMLFSATHAKRIGARRQQVLMGNTQGSSCSLPLLDDHLRRRTAGASRVQVFVASTLAQFCRQVVRTRSFEYAILHMIRMVELKRRERQFISHGRGTR